MKVVNGVWVGATVIAVAAIVLFLEFVANRASDRAPGDQQAATAPNAPGAAPGNGGDDPYKQDRAQAIDAVRNAYFAAGCKMFTADEVLPLVAQKASDLNEEAKAHGINDEKLQEELNAAGQDGAMKAQQSGACDYWEQHPDAVRAVRQAIREAAEP